MGSLRSINLTSRSKEAGNVCELILRTGPLITRDDNKLLRACLKKGTALVALLRNEGAIRGGERSCMKNGWATSMLNENKPRGEKANLCKTERGWGQGWKLGAKRRGKSIEKTRNFPRTSALRTWGDPEPFEVGRQN